MFELSKSQREIQKAAWDFAKGEFDKVIAYELVKQGAFPRKIWKKAAELGFLGIHFPDSMAGGGMGVLENVLVTEAFCRSDSSIGSALALATSGSECILRFGSAEMKSNCLPRLAEGEILSGRALTETQRGEDYLNIQTTAEKRGDTWVINGTKLYVDNGGDPDTGIYVVLSRAISADSSLESDLSLFLVESSRAGLTFNPVGKKLGNNLTATASLSLKEVEIPARNLIGDLGGGSAYLERYFDESLIIAAARALGTAQGSLDRVLEYVKGRVQFGKKIAEFQVSQHKIADMATKIELARLITYKAAWKFDQGKADSSLSAMAKLTAARTAMEVGAQTIQLFGGYGFMTEYDVERYYRDAKVIELQEGIKDVQKDIIARNVIGKIR
ncbi:MAG: acyl-CoA dehydrogenase family protein [SAR324 cluster bacterium]|nr:acyl-CoA dehydrogenase family protein [SAR324 cluster bacterium]